MLQEFQKLPAWAKAMFVFLAIVVGVASYDFLQTDPGSENNINQESSASQTQQVGITVRNRQDLQSIDNVIIDIIFDGPPVQKMTDRNGYIEIQIPERKSTQITLTKQGFKTVTETINLEVDPDTTRIIYLDPDLQ